MKKGYYLSTYICISKLGYLYNQSGRHDHNISLWRVEDDNKVSLIRYWELERCTGIKQHKVAFFSVEHFKTVMAQLLAEENLTWDDIIEVWGTPELGNISNYFFNEEYSEYAYHSICHVYSGLMLESDLFENENILCLSMDSCPDKYVDRDALKKKFYMGAYSKKGEIKTFPIISPAEMWEAASDYYNLREGTLMALAYASASELIVPFEFKCTAEDYDSRSLTYAKVQASLRHLENMENLDFKVNFWDKRFTRRDNIISIAMKLIQRYSTELVEKMISQICNKYNVNPEETYLAISGGYGLNCPTNSRIMEKFKFKGFIAPPCINDSGISLGCALYVFNKRLGRFHFSFQGAFQGEEDKKILENIKKYADIIVSISNRSPQKVAEDIEKEVIVWFDDRSEIGPRALGHRSLLGNPCSVDTKNRLNEIKQRQWWRPVAPIILEEELKNWFDSAYKSPYMLHNFKVNAEKKEKVPAILHLDNTARVQSISERDNKFLYDVIREFQKKVGVPMICNTSLNDRGEPIINTIAGALEFALIKKIRIVYINHIRLELKLVDSWEKRNPTRQIDFKNYLSSDMYEQYKKELNPYKCSLEMLDLYIRSGEEEDITTKKGIRKLEILTRTTNNKYVISTD